jgi:hypothetical protein
VLADPVAMHQVACPVAWAYRPLTKQTRISAAAAARIVGAGSVTLRMDGAQMTVLSRDPTLLRFHARPVCAR